MAHRPLVLTLLALALAPLLSAQRYSFRYYAHAQGLGNLVVFSVMQDSTGFLWVATGNGLYRYGGNRFSAYGKSEGLPDHRVLAIHEAPGGTLWIGTRFGFAIRGDSFQTIRRDLRCSSPNCLASDPAGLVYAATNQGLLIANRAWQHIEHPAQAGGIGAQSVYVDADGVVWFGCGERVCRLDGRSVRVWGDRAGLPPDRWDAILRDREGNVWVRSLTRLMRMTKGSAQFVAQPGIPPAMRFGSLFLDSAGVLFVPTELGLMRRTGASWDRVGIENGLPTNSTSWVTEDREGSIWVGLAGVGLARWVGYSQWESWTHAEGLAGSSVRAILHAANGDLWVGTERGLQVRRRGASSWRLFTQADGLGGNKVRALATTSDGAIWVGSESGGLARVDPRRGSLTRVRSPARAVFNLQVDAGGKLWANGDGVVYVCDDVTAARPRFREERPPELGKSESVAEILYDSRSRLWFAAQRGLFLRERGSWRRLTRQDGLPADLISHLAEAPDGSIWAATSDSNSLCRLSPRGGRVEITRLNRPGAGNADLSSLAADATGKLWISTDDGLEIYDGQKWLYLRQDDGLLWNDCVSRALRIEPDGTVWIGTSQGLAAYHPSARKRMPQPPAVITSLKVDNVTVAHVEEPRIAWRNHGSINVNFAGLTFVNETAVRFHYRLLGLDDKWSSTDQHKVTYASLSPGQYTFEVKARNAYGTWSREPARLTFVILPPWWQGWPFRAAAILLLCAILILFWRWRMYLLVAERNRLEAAVADRTSELAEEKTRAEEANRLKSQFLANMSHEVRTPMNAILGMTTLALEGQLDASQREYLETVHLSAESLLDVLNDILDLSKMEAGRMELDDVPFSPAKCVADAVSTMRPAALRKGLHLEYRIADDVPPAASGDAARLRQILLNIICNAVKFTDRGTILVEVAVESGRVGELTLRFEVSDTGIGIPREHQKTVFEAFRQADGSTTRRFGGTGLGLTICTRLVELMGGSIALESEPGRGSTFGFTTRFRPASAPPPSEPPHEVTGDLRSLHVLLAEDNVVNQKLAVELLKRRGHSVAVVGTGSAAVRAVAEAPFDVVLMDVQMPEMDGLEATAAIRRAEAGTSRRLPIVAMTAHAMKGDREKCLAAGMDAYVSKPVQPAELFRILAQVCAQACHLQNDMA